MPYINKIKVNGTSYNLQDKNASGITVDSELDDSSENPVQNSVITEKLSEKLSIDSGIEVVITDHEDLNNLIIPLENSFQKAILTLFTDAQNCSNRPQHIINSGTTTFWVLTISYSLNSGVQYCGFDGRICSRLYRGQDTWSNWTNEISEIYEYIETLLQNRLTYSDIIADSGEDSVETWSADKTLSDYEGALYLQLESSNNGE